MHIVFGTALLIIAVLLIVGILSRRHWISTVLAVAIALIGVATIYTSTSIGPSSERQLYARAVLDNLSARLFGSDAGFRTDPKMVARFETLKQRPAELTAFLRAMPKGGDLHNHLSGAIYAENYLDWARAGSLCVDQAALALRPPPCRPLFGTVPLEDVLTGKTGPDLTRDRLIDALSVRNYEIYDRSGHDQFFATFGAFDAAGDGKSGAMLAEVMHRAAEQNISYLELMMSPGMSGARALASALIWNDDLATLRAQLSDTSLDAIVTETRAEIDTMEAEARRILDCAGARPPACDVAVRHQAQVIRVFPAPQVFARTELPDVSVSLHAGELTIGLVPPKDLRFHIRDAIDVAGANRIGHGVDLLYEDAPYALLEDMVARDILVEINLTSNAVILGVEGPDHPFETYLAAGVPLTLSTDDEGVSPKRITVNLAPADLAKEGSHFDLPIALGLLAAMDVLPGDTLGQYSALGELALDGALAPVAGVLPAAIDASARDRGLICPAIQGGEAAWAGDLDILAAPDMLALVNHFKGTQMLSPPTAKAANGANMPTFPDLRDIKGQESAKRALEIAAAGGHNLLLSGPPDSGKSMLAQRLPGILPPLSSAEALEVSMIHSLSNTLPEGGLMTLRPFRDPHHSASLAALVGGGARAKPGEVSLAHRGVLFLDELPEFARQALESLRQPIESGRAVVARANNHVAYPARFQLIAAMNPCRCGHLDDPGLACSRAPKCAVDYQARLSGPLLDRTDLHVDVPAVAVADLALPPPAEGSAEVAARVAAARRIQAGRYAEHGLLTNAEADGELLESVAGPDADGKALLVAAAEKLKLSARGYHRVLRVARTLADLDEGDIPVQRGHIAEALSYRRVTPGR